MCIKVIMPINFMNVQSAFLNYLLWQAYKMQYSYIFIVLNILNIEGLYDVSIV